MHKIKSAICIILLTVIISCKQYPSEQEIFRNIDAGNFTLAEEQIQLLIEHESIPDSVKKEMNDQLDLMNRIGKDFSLTEDEIKEKLLKYFPQLNDSMLRDWEREKSLEMRVIGSLCYSSPLPGTMVFRQNGSRDGTSSLFRQTCTTGPKYIMKVWDGCRLTSPLD